MSTLHTRTSHEREFSHERFSPQATVEWVMQNGIEVRNPELLSAQIETLVNEFSIEPSVLAQGRNKLLLAAIANDLGERPFGENDEKSSRVADMIALSFGENSKLKDFVKDSEYAPGFSERRTLEAYEALTNEELSREMTDYIATNEDMRLLKERLGVAADNENPFTVKVMDIGGDYIQDGWHPSIDWESEDAVATHQSQREVSEKLKANGGWLSAESGYGEEDSLPPAWVSYNSDGSKILCLARPTAEKIMYPDEPRGKYYTVDDYRRDLAFLHHEYTHTQRPVLRGSSVGLGIALEELRAEHFSGDRHGYLDIKRYFRSIAALYNFTPKGSFEGQGQFDAEQFEIDIAQHMGLDGYLDAMTVIPKAYAESSTASPFLKELVRRDDGIDGHFKSMYERAVEQFGAEEVSRRVSAFVDATIQAHQNLTSPTVTVEGLLEYKWPKPFSEMTLAEYRSRQ